MKFVDHPHSSLCFKIDGPVAATTQMLLLLRKILCNVKCSLNKNLAIGCVGSHSRLFDFSNILFQIVSICDGEKPCDTATWMYHMDVSHVFQGLKGKSQQGSSSKTASKAQNLFSSASQSFLNLTGRRSTTERERETSRSLVLTTTAKQSLNASQLTKGSHAPDKTVVPTSKNCQIIGSNSIAGESCVKKKGVRFPSEKTDTSEKKKCKASEKLPGTKKSLFSKKSVTKCTKQSKKISDSSEKQLKNKNSAKNDKSSDSKLCFIHSKSRKKNSHEDKVDRSAESNSEICNNFEINVGTVCKQEKQKSLRDQIIPEEESTSSDIIVCQSNKNSSDDECITCTQQNKNYQDAFSIKFDSEPYRDAHLKSALKVLRSNLSPEEKLYAIKYNHDYWKRIENGEVENTQLENILQSLTDKSVNLHEKNEICNINATSLTKSLSLDSSDIENVKEICVKGGAKGDNKMNPSHPASHTELSGKISKQHNFDIQAEVSDKLDQGPSDNKTYQRNVTTVISINTTDDNTQLSKGTPPPKSPVTVQEWVNSIDLSKGDERTTLFPKPLPLDKNKVDTSNMFETSGDNEFQNPADSENVHDSSAEDNLTLGAEAYNLEGVHHRIARKSNMDASPTSLSPEPNKISLGDLHGKQNSFNSETSCISGVSTLSSVESLLEARKEDPEEILLALGFGGKQYYNPVARIPQRFLSQQSHVRGVDVDLFLQQQEDLLQRQDNSCFGYRGLSASSQSDGLPSSAIANRILDKLDDSEKKQRKSSASSSPSLQDIVSVMMAASAFRSGKMRHSSDSILDPANREFLEKQGKDDPLERSKKLIIGGQTYSFDQEGVLVQTSQHSSSSDDSSPTTNSRSSKWKKMYQKLEDHATCVHEVDEENLKSLTESTESNNKNKTSVKETEIQLSQKDKSDWLLLKKLSKKRPLVCRQSRVDEDSVFIEGTDIISNDNLTSLSSSLPNQCTEIVQSTNTKIKTVPRIKDSQCKDSFELDELSIAEGAENETSNQIDGLLEPEAPCNRSDSSGFADDAVSETTAMGEYSKTYINELYYCKSKTCAVTDAELLNEIETKEVPQDNGCDNYSIENGEQKSDVPTKSEQCSKLKRAFSFVHREQNVGDSAVSASDQRRHSATVPGELIFSQLQHRSSLWHLHPPLWWNNLNESSNLSCSEVTLTSHLSMEKVYDDTSNTVQETDISTPVFISSQNVQLSNRNTQCDKSELRSASVEYKKTNHIHSELSYNQLEGQIASDNAETFHTSMSDNVFHHSSIKTEAETTYEGLSVDSLFFKLRKLKNEVENDLQSYATDSTKYRSNIRTLTQLKKNILTQVYNIECLLHELKNNLTCEYSVTTIEKMIELICKQNKEYQELGKFFEDKTHTVKCRDVGCQTLPED